MLSAKWDGQMESAMMGVPLPLPFNYRVSQGEGDLISHPLYLSWPGPAYTIQTLKASCRLWAMLEAPVPAGADLPTSPEERAQFSLHLRTPI